MVNQAYVQLNQTRLYHACAGVYVRLKGRLNYVYSVIY